MTIQKKCSKMLNLKLCEIFHTLEMNSNCLFGNLLFTHFSDNSDTKFDFITLARSPLLVRIATVRKKIQHTQQIWNLTEKTVMVYAQYIHHSCRSKRANVCVNLWEQRVLFVVWSHRMQPQFTLKMLLILVADLGDTLYFTNLWINISEFESPSSHQRISLISRLQLYAYLSSIRNNRKGNKTIFLNQKLTPFPVRENFSFISPSPKTLQKVFIFVGWTTFGNSLLCVSAQKGKRERKI
jgi:hypothetical protein